MIPTVALVYCITVIVSAYGRIPVRRDPCLHRTPLSLSFFSLLAFGCAERGRHDSIRPRNSAYPLTFSLVHRGSKEGEEEYQHPCWPQANRQVSNDETPHV